MRLSLLMCVTDPLPAVCDVYDAMAEGAPQLYDCYERNIVFDWEAGDIDGAQAKIDEAVAQGRATGRN